MVGKSGALTFNVTDIAALHADLKAKGVTFVQEPDAQPWGTFAFVQLHLQSTRLPAGHEARGQAKYVGRLHPGKAGPDQASIVGP